MIEVCRDLNELNPKIKELAIKLLEECAKEGLKIKISETYRTVERQNYLYAQGRTRPGGIVTNAKGSDMSSFHQWRLAFDIFNNVRGDEYNTTVLTKAGKIGQKLGLEWGGSWSGFRDIPHFQYTFGLTISDLKAGKKPPTKTTASVVPPQQPTKKTTTIAQEKAVTKDEAYEAAIAVLVQRGIINKAGSWIPEPDMKYVPDLVGKMSCALIQEEPYEEKIKFLVEQKLITDEEKWTNQHYVATDIKWLIKKFTEKLIK